jgi:hypothetical protein
MKYLLILTVLIFPSLSYSQITQQPSSSAICSGLNTHFKIKASGNSLLYKWQVKRGNSWTDITSTGAGPSYSNFLSDSLVLTNVVDSNNTYQYRCITSNADTSSAGTLTVHSKSQAASGISASTNPVCKGSSTVLSAIGGQLGYLASWKWNKGNCNSSILRTGNSYTDTPSSITTYFANAVGFCNTTACVSITINVNSLPNISSQPSSVSICPSTNTSFSVSATGTGLSYQWQVNQGSVWSNITSAGTNPTYSNFNTASLSLSNVVSANNSWQYRCIVSGTCNPSVTSNPATLTVNTTPAIISQPTNSTICEGQGTSFSVNASGTGLSYQWEVNNGSNWTNITNGGSNPTYSNSNSSTLSLSNTVYANNSYSYKCKITGTCGPLVTSNSAQLTINTSPVISNHPSNSSICAGLNTSFSVNATGTNLGYQWQVNQGSGWTNISSSGSNPVYSNYTTNTLGLSSTVASNNGYLYRCVISGTCSPSVNSNQVLLTIFTSPALTSQPNSSTICEGLGTSFNITATGTNLNYQWQVNSGTGWSDITSPGANPSFSNYNSNSLVLNKAISWNNGYRFRCKVSGLCAPSIISDSSTLNVNTIPNINQNPIDASACELKNTYFQINASGTNLNYQWEINSKNNWIPISTYNTKSVFKNWNTNKLDLSNIDTAENNASFRCKISNIACNAAFSNTAKLIVNQNPVVNAGIDFAICYGETDYLKPNVIKSNGILKYTWTPSVGLSNPGISNPSVSSLNKVTYKLTVEDQNSCLASDDVELTVNPKPLISITNDTAICVYDSKQLFATGGNKFIWSPQSGLNNYTIANPIAKPSSTTKYTVSVENSYSCKSTESVTISVNPLPKTFAGKDTNICTGSSLQLHATGANFYKWVPAVNLNFNDINNPIFNSPISQKLIVEGGNIFGCALLDTINITVWNLPNVDAGNTREICNGDSTQLIAKGANKYLWNSNAVNFISNMGSPVIKPKNSSIYKLTGTDLNGCINTDSVPIIVNQLPIIDAGANTSICQGSSISIKAVGAVQYRWRKNPSLNDSNISNPTAKPSSNTIYYLTGIDAKNCKNIDSIEITVIPLPQVNIKGDTLVCQNARWSAYLLENFNYKCFWRIEKGAIQTGQGSNNIKIHWKDSMFSDSLIVNVRMQDFPFCASKDVLNIKSRSTKSVNPAEIVAKANNIYTNILICKNPNYESIKWGFENKKTNIEVFTQSGNSWVKYDKIDTFNNYYWAYVGNDTNCLTKSYYNEPVSLSSGANGLESNISIYPNPSAGIYMLKGIAVGSQIEIFNSLGQIIESFEIKNETEIIDLKNENGNSFFVRIVSENQTVYQKIFKY